MVTLPVPVSTLRNTYRDRLLFPEKGWRLPDKRENTGPPEQGVTCYCFGLLLTTSGAVVGIFGRGAGDQPATTPTVFTLHAVG